MIGSLQGRGGAVSVLDVGAVNGRVPAQAERVDGIWSLTPLIVLPGS